MKLVGIQVKQYRTSLEAHWKAQQAQNAEQAENAAQCIDVFCADCAYWSGSSVKKRGDP